MTTPTPGQDPLFPRGRRVESAAVAGLIYSVLTAIALWILNSIPDPSAAESEWRAWLDDDGNVGALHLALNLAGFGAVTFLWFVAVIRRRLGEREDRFFATVFFGSALVYVGLWLVGMSLLAAPALMGDGGGSPSWDSYRFADATARGLLLVAAPRIQAVFVATSATLFLRTSALPRWLAYLGYGLALVMFVVPFVATPIGVGLPAFVLVASVTVFFSRGEIKAATAGRKDPSPT